MNIPRPVWMATSAAMAAGSGVLAAVAIGAGTANGVPLTTTTINAAVGQSGPTGAAGPKGAAGPTGPAGTAGGGAEDCPTGSTFGKLVVNHPGGQTSILTCILP